MKKTEIKKLAAFMARQRYQNSLPLSDMADVEDGIQRAEAVFASISDATSRKKMEKALAKI